MTVGDCVIALDVGGTAMKGALVAPDLTVLAERRTPTPRADGPAAVADGIVAAVVELISLASSMDLSVRAAGVVVPGIVDDERGQAVYAANLGWRDLPLRALVADRTGLPVSIGHDVRAGGLAEVAIGAGRGGQDVMFVSIGTGIAASVVVHGRPVVSGGYAGELGHVMVVPDGEPCTCGLSGCLETVASAASIARRYGLRSGHPVSGALEVVDRLLAGDPHAAAVWDEAVAGLAVALAGAVGLLAPEIVILGGGLASAGPVLLDPLRTALAARLSFQRKPTLVAAALGESAGALGAALLALESTALESQEAR